MSEPLVRKESREILSAWLHGFEAAIDAGDATAAAGKFLSDGHLRDHLTLTWDLRTFSGRDQIAEALKGALAERKPRNFAIEDREPQRFERKGLGQTLETFFTFETNLASCRGYIRLLADREQVWGAWTVFTSMEELKGFEDRSGANRPVAATSEHPSGGQLPCVATAEATAGVEPSVVIIGAGQAGLTLAARLRQLGVETLVVEREARIGDGWRNRYQSLVLHNQVWANHLPYLPFPATWPAYITKDQIADWLEWYSTILALRVSTGTQVDGVSYDEAEGRWTLGLSRPGEPGAEVHPRHLVLATGIFGKSRRIELPGVDEFEGAVVHGTDYRGGDDYAGARVLVLGAGSSAHDVAQDLHAHGAHVTMLQRSTTCVVSLEPGAAVPYSLYRENGGPLEDCDMLAMSFPSTLLAELHREMTRRVAKMDAELLEGLARAGFGLDFGEDGSGFLMKFYRSGGGYYINVGASDLIVAGEIAVRRGVIDHLVGKTVAFSDGSKAEFDVVVLATGYSNMQESIRAIVGDEVADRVGPVWGMDAEGEFRAMWRPTGQPGFWIAGGSLNQCRPYSKRLALQIKAREERLVR